MALDAAGAVEEGVGGWAWGCCSSKGANCRVLTHWVRSGRGDNQS